ncbi:hypothetical protein TPR58_10745 [Sphingomonas sp. HF-S3]|uniref:Uncharacterized protein n=1 Tax=Sphingomonas rustica TaxID=3103142 RepID=A0ABV0B7T7_9SPHN
MIAPLLFTIAAAHAAPIPADPAAIVSLSARENGEACTKDGRWCVSLVPARDGARPVVRAGATTRAPADQARKDDEDAPSVWPRLVVLGDGRFLAGVQSELSTGYSGGGGNATRVKLYEVTVDRPGGRAILDQPIRASLTIRACFDEKDSAKRLDACHDEYGFSARLGLVPGGAGRLPILSYTTSAWAFPRGASRSSDSTTRPPLRKTDLVRQADPKCSFTRRFTFDAGTGSYRPDQPFPACGDYTEL